MGDDKLWENTSVANRFRESGEKTDESGKITPASLFSIVLLNIFVMVMLQKIFMLWRQFHEYYG